MTRAQGQRRRSGATMDARCPHGGYIYSFNGAHSLFVDTIRSLRALALSHALGHDSSRNRMRRSAPDTARAACVRDGDPQRFLRDRRATIRRARTHGAREPLQRRQRHVPRARARSRAIRRSARGRGDWHGRCSGSPSSSSSSRRSAAPTPPMKSATADSEAVIVDAARATCDFYIEAAACADGVPYWDTGAPGLCGARATGATAPPIRSTIVEPVDSSAAAIGAQGLLRLGQVLCSNAATTAPVTYRRDCAWSTRCSTRAART